MKVVLFVNCFDRLYLLFTQHWRYGILLCHYDFF